MRNFTTLLLLFAAVSVYSHDAIDGKRLNRLGRLDSGVPESVATALSGSFIIEGAVRRNSDDDNVISRYLKRDMKCKSKCRPRQGRNKQQCLSICVRKGCKSKVRPWKLSRGILIPNLLHQSFSPALILVLV